MSKAGAKGGVKTSSYRIPEDFSDRDIEKAFREMDVDSNGFISAQDLRTFFRALGEELSDEEVDEMIRELDVDGDGQVAIDEFYKLAKSK